MGWFDEARFGMFVHWSHVAQRGWELSWPLVGGIPLLAHSDPVGVDEYYARALEFRPEPGAPREWMRLARRSGMRYVVLTTKHHDGFALFPTGFSIAQTPYDGDLVAEFVEAARTEGLRLGFYFSLSDWHHPDYPAFSSEDDSYIPYLGRRSETWERFLEELFDQVRRLCTDYGTIDLFWFDGGWERSAEEWRASELRGLIRELQPDALVNDRLPGEGDFATPEQSVPPVPPEGRWETCMTMNGSWGYVPKDTAYKPARELVHTLCETAAKGGNLLLNVSPRADGSLPPEQTERLEAVGAWMEAGAEAIHGTEPGLEPWQFYGPSTRKGDRVFLHVLMRPYDVVTVRGVRIGEVRSVRHLATGTELAYETRATVEEHLSGEPVGEVVIELPDELLTPPATVLELALAPATPR